jgi:ribosomal protein S17E
LPSLWTWRIGTKTTKRAACLIIERFYGQLSFNFQDNKRVCDEVAGIPANRMRNKIAGCVASRRARFAASLSSSGGGAREARQLDADDLPP